MARDADQSEDRKANRRGAARLAAVQALYQMDIAGTGSNDILAEFESHWIGREVEGAQYLPAEAAFFRDVVVGRRARATQARSADRRGAGAAAGRSSASKRSCARCCAPAPTSSTTAAMCRRASSSSEYVDVAHAFVDRDETGMVNAVLDQLARQLRAGEFERVTG